MQYYGFTYVHWLESERERLNERRVIMMQPFALRDRTYS